jgi:hypothetical protein
MDIMAIFMMRLQVTKRSIARPRREICGANQNRAGGTINKQGRLATCGPTDSDFLDWVEKIRHDPVDAIDSHASQTTCMCRIPLCFSAPQWVFEARRVSLPKASRYIRRYP